MVAHHCEIPLSPCQCSESLFSLAVREGYENRRKNGHNRFLSRVTAKIKALGVSALTIECDILCGVVNRPLLSKRVTASMDNSYSKALVSSSCTCLQEGMATDNKLFVAFFVETIERYRTLFLSSKYSCVFFTIETRNIYFLCSLAHKAMRMAAAMASINKKAGTTYIINV